MRLIDFSIGGQGEPGSAMVRTNRRLTAFCEAVIWRLANDRVDAPFRKIFIGLPEELTPDPYAPFLAPPIVHVSSEHSGSALASLSTSPFRIAAGRIAMEGLDAIGRHLGWRSESLMDFVGWAAANVGPYVLELRRLPVRNNRTGRSYATVHEISEEGSKVYIERRSPDGAVIARGLVVAEDEPKPMVYFFNPRKAVVEGDELVYLAKEGHVIARVAMPT